MARLTCVLSLLLACTPLVLAQQHPPLFPKNSIVKMLDATTYPTVLSSEKTAIVAFVAPWCGYCKKLAPEYVRAAESLKPLVPFYAVDCDDNMNKPICSSQKVEGFPTIKSFPRGLKGGPHLYDGARTGSALVDWAKSEVPNKVKTLRGADAVAQWIATDDSRPRALLLTTAKTLPVLWRVLGSTYAKTISFAVAKDEDGSISGQVGVDRSDKSAVAAWVDGQMLEYKGALKFEPLKKFFDALLEPARGARDEL